MSFEYLKLTGVSYGFTYHDFVVEGVNLTIPRGRFVSIVGPSGSGKTTLLKLMCGIYEPWNEISSIFAMTVILFSIIRLLDMFHR
ncbi:MAG: ATP-binding cassette domain-containing protein [Candidatus Nitrosocosmicus sp.]|nr:ATP-binding cassette domain-containing protein [Candidatus Nitrosocosmicus sp.]